MEIGVEVEVEVDAGKGAVAEEDFAWQNTETAYWTSSSTRGVLYIYLRDVVHSEYVVEYVEVSACDDARSSAFCIG